MRTHAGFTLIELMIVVCIIGIIMAIAVPSMLRARMQSNEASTIEDLRTIITAQLGYRTVHEAFGSFEDLVNDEYGGEGTAFLANTWHEGVEKNGYVFSMDSVQSNTFVCYADPIDPGHTGERYFRGDASGSIRYSFEGRPAENSPAID